MASSLRPLLLASSVQKKPFALTWSRTFYYKFERTRTPPLQEPKESPYIVGPYLKPDYVAPKYITDAIEYRKVDDFDHFILTPTKVEPDEERRIQLLLIEDVEGLGVAGQVVNAPYRFGASKLIAMRKAEYFNEFSNSWYKFGPKTALSASSALSPRTIRLLKSQTFDLPITRSTQVEPWHIALTLRLAGCFCPIEAIDKKSISVYYDENDVQKCKCTVTINNHEQVEVDLCFTKQEAEPISNDDT